MSRKGPGWANSRQKRVWRERLMLAQGGICAGCGRAFGVKERSRRSPLLPTLDHVIPRSAASLSHGPHNLLLKHRICNELRENAPATGCDLVWQAVVYARLDLGAVVDAPSVTVAAHG